MRIAPDATTGAMRNNQSLDNPITALFSDFGS
jgi:hypothetical protein